MIPLGLIVNELVSNALKHAYSGIKEKGVLTIELKEKNGLLELNVTDNGIGMKEDQFFSSESFGNKMINAFKNKLKANIKIQNDRGTSVSLQIQNYKLVA
jgi:two-component sensor histidine kinase